MLVHPELKTTRVPSSNASQLDSTPQSYLPESGPDWRFVSADQAWLESLIPPVNNREGWTTLAAAFTDASFDNSTSAVSGGWASLGGTIESTIATTVVDGMSRVGLAANGGAHMHHVMPDRYQWLRFLPEKYVPSKAPAFFDRILKGRTVVLPPEGAESENLTRLTWRVTVAGLAFKADEVVYYLALAVLFTHTLIASVQTGWTLTTRRSSDAWDGVEQLVVLGCQSKPTRNEGLKNTCSGIRYGRTFQHSARISIRSGTDVLGEEEAVQLLLGDSVSEDEGELDQVQENVSYGSSV